MRIGKRCFTAVLMLLLQLPLMPAGYAIDVEDYLFTEVALPISAVSLYDNFLTAYLEGEYEQADASISHLLQQAPAGFVLPAHSQARLLRLAPVCGWSGPSAFSAMARARTKRGFAPA